MRNHSPLDRARSAFQKAVGKAHVDNREPATVGWRKSATEVLIDVPGRANYAYITKSDQTVAIALNRAGVPRAVFLPVWVVLENNTLVIVGRNNDDAAALVNVPDSDYGVAAHPLSTHSDVTLTALADGQMLEWDATAGKWVNVAAGAVINAATADTPLDADKFGFWDVVDAALKSITWANIKATLLTYFSTIFAVLAGTAGGQSLSGGNAANDDLTLQGTSHATRTTSYTFLEPNGGRVSVGGVTPSSSTVLDVGGTARIRQFFYVSRNADAITSYFYLISRGAADGSNFGNPLGNGAGEFAVSGLAGLIFGTVDATPVAFGTNNVERMRILSGGNVGMGTTSPQGRLHIHDGTSGWLKAAKYGVGAAETSIIPDGTGDVVRGVTVIAAIAWGSAGTIDRPAGIRILNTPGAGSVESDLATVGVLKLKLYSTGALVIYRGSGTETWNIMFDIIWQ